jgi:hypothetical protein
MKALTARTHLPYDPLPADGTREINTHAARGETVSLSFSLEAHATVDDLEVSASALYGTGGRELSATMDPYVVHRWMQAGLGVFQTQAIEVGELLLKDDRVTLRDGYVRNCGSAWHIHKSRSRYDPPRIRLSGPVTTFLAAGTTKQFWISLAVPASAARGDYHGSIVVRHNGQTLLEVGVRVTVLDINLAPPLRDTMLWYRGTINCHHWRHFVRRDVYETQLRDIYDHGFRSISLLETDARRLQQALDTAQAIGFCDNVVLDGFRKELWSSVNFGKLRPVAYVSDEIDGDPNRLRGHVESIQHAKSNGVRTMASILDWRTLEQTMSKALGLQPDLVSVYAPGNRQRLGSSRQSGLDGADLYFYWQAHMEKPLVHRLLAGLLFWKSGADGISPYCYQHLPGIPNSPFDDFDLWDATQIDRVGRRFRDHMTTYPARNGVIHTLQWKGLTEGLTDFRYLTTLDLAIESAEKAEYPVIRERGAKARAQLDSVVEKFQWDDVDILSENSAAPYPDFSSRDMLNLRSRIVDELKALGGVAVVED